MKIFVAKHPSIWTDCSFITHVLQDAVTADGQQHVLLQLVVLGECLHRVKIS